MDNERKTRGHNLKMTRSKKLNKKWIGPFEIIQKINVLNYSIKNTNKRSRKLIVHINRLKRCHMSTT